MAGRSKRKVGLSATLQSFKASLEHEPIDMKINSKPLVAQKWEQPIDCREVNTTWHGRFVCRVGKNKHHCIEHHESTKLTMASACNSLIQFSLWWAINAFWVLLLLRAFPGTCKNNSQIGGMRVKSY